MLQYRPHNHKNKGLVLLPILILMLILSLFGLHALTGAGLAIKSQTEDWDSSHLRSTATAILRSVENKLSIDTADCFIQLTNPNLLTKQPLSWWQSNSCNGHFKQIQYYYVIEHLGQDVCAMPSAYVENTGEAMAADYYRITLFSINPNHSNIILQSTIAKANRAMSLCDNRKMHTVVLGRQMQRELFRRMET